MAISNELSSDIANAILLSKDRSPTERDKLKKVIFEIHTTLQRLTEASREHRRKAMAASQERARTI
jgi:hypothetical protein